MFRKAIALLLVAMAMFLTACSQDEPKVKENKTMVIYSQLEQDFTEALLTAYVEEKADLKITAIYEFNPDAPEPDMILAERSVLLDLQKKDGLQQYKLSFSDKLNKKFVDADGYWYGMFYDPAVLLINQHFARTIGQEKLRGWFDLEYLRETRIVSESISNSRSSTNFLCALASNIGEATALNYLWNINRNVPQYAKFPFTPVRMTAVGDADISITRQSYVAKYLENNFPAYVVMPKEGTPINLYGAAIYKGSKNSAEAVKFIEWLITDQEAKAVSQSIDTGFTFVFSSENKDKAINPELLWLNTEYIQKAQEEALVSLWLEKVRFGDKNQEGNNEIRFSKPRLS